MSILEIIFQKLNFSILKKENSKKEKTEEIVNREYQETEQIQNIYNIITNLMIGQM